MLLDILNDVLTTVSSSKDSCRAPEPRPVIKWDFDENKPKVEMEKHNPWDPWVY